MGVAPNIDRPGENMAASKRPLDGSDLIKEKKRRVQGPNQPQHQKPVQTVRSSKARRAALPSPDNSSVGSEDLAGRVIPGESTNGTPEMRALTSRETIPVRSKTSTSAQRGAALHNGNSRYQNSLDGTCALTILARNVVA